MSMISMTYNNRDLQKSMFYGLNQRYNRRLQLVEVYTQKSTLGLHSSSKANVRDVPYIQPRTSSG